ncbi:MAG TPA: PfkB family carbohydrate kinase [Acidimicrobiales bacterium]|jgi:rfaE bifunctional protein nucleotidyltransferase chain/domain/rfaE bifunctional protein kinase chain/domain|nr:PfkB family carbohydrate kinase [Acidimicrobiales bacterium]
MIGRGGIVVIGDSLVDRDVEGRADRLCPDAPAPVLDELETTSRPGGAALAAAIASAEGAAVTLVTAIGADPAGDDLRRMLSECDVAVVDLGLAGPTPEKIRLRSGGRVLLRLDRGGPPPAVGSVACWRPRSGDAPGAVLVSDYGRGITAEASVRDLVVELGVPVVWDPHPRGACPVPGTRVVTPNRSELPGSPITAGLSEVSAAAGNALLEWGARGIAVTLGAGGALLVDGDGPPLAVPTPAVDGGDTCGAGDCFAAVVTRCLSGGALASEAVIEGVRAASAFVASGGAGAWIPLRGSPAQACQVSGGAGHDRPMPLQRFSEGAPDARGGAAVAHAGHGRQTVVATGGCFDILHAGHLHLLEAAGALGDRLVVLVNSDSSIRRLKGPDRPVVAEADRVAMLEALACVDAVVVFDDDTPAPALRRLRPDVFVKGGDYSGRPLPEAAVLASWGGQAVVVPYLAGRSTTGLLRRVAAEQTPSG